MTTSPSQSRQRNSKQRSKTGCGARANPNEWGEPENLCMLFIHLDVCQERAILRYSSIGIQKHNREPCIGNDKRIYPSKISLYFSNRFLAITDIPFNILFLCLFIGWPRNIFVGSLGGHAEDIQFLC